MLHFREFIAAGTRKIPSIAFGLSESRAEQHEPGSKK